MTTEYVIQIRDSDGWLAVAFEVTNGNFVPQESPLGFTQVIITNTASYNNIINAYKEHTTNLSFSYDEQAETVSCSGSLNDTWNID